MLYDRIKKNIHNNIIYLREQESLSLADMGKILGVSKNAIFKIEHQQTEVSIKHLCTISEHFNVPLADLIIKDISLNEN